MVVYGLGMVRKERWVVLQEWWCSIVSHYILYKPVALITAYPRFPATSHYAAVG